MKIFGITLLFAGPAAIIGVVAYGYHLLQIEIWGSGYQMAAIGIWVIWGAVALGFAGLTTVAGILLIVFADRRAQARAPETSKETP
jgi:hypothetical protein